MAVIADIINGNSAQYTIRGWTLERVYIVTELVGPPDQMLIEAATADGVPQFGESHPEIADAFAIDFSAESIEETANAAKIVVTYRQFNEDYIVNISSTGATFTMNDYVVDQTTPGTLPMTLKYTYPADYEKEPGAAGKEFTQGVSVAVNRDLPGFEITRTEWTSITADALSGHAVGVKLTGNILVDRANTFNNTLNEAGWNIRPATAAGYWRCTITAASAEDGLAYRVTYRFAGDANDWRSNEVFKDFYDNQPVPDPTYANSVDPITDGSAADFPFFYYANFSALELR